MDKYFSDMKKCVLVRFVIQEDRAPETAVSRVRIQPLDDPIQ